MFVSAFFQKKNFSRIFETCGYYSCTVQWTVATKLDFSNFLKPISAHSVLFTDPQISLFNNFLIKNGSHSTIYTFKNYFVTVFFNFQFSAVSKQTLSLFSCSTYCLNLQLWFFSHLQEINCVDQISSSLFTCWLFSTPTTIMTCKLLSWHAVIRVQLLILVYLDKK